MGIGSFMFRLYHSYRSTELPVRIRQVTEWDRVSVNATTRRPISSPVEDRTRILQTVAQSP
jgi:hypothetical protein